MMNPFAIFPVLISFLLELFAGDLLFAARFRKKAHIILRCIMSLAFEVILGIPIYLLCYSNGSWIIQNTLYYLLLFFVSLIVLFCCFDEPPLTLVSCGVSGYMAQHIGSQIYQMLWSSQLSAHFGAELSRLLFFYITQVLVYGSIYVLVYYLFARKAFQASLSRQTNRNLFYLSVTTLFVVTILSSVRDSYADESFALMAVSRLFSIFCCVFLLYLRSGILAKNAMEQEREALLRLHALEKEQYEQRRENIELINLKCHDLRHRMEVWERQGGKADPSALQEMKQMIGIYDAAVKTGNETLDTILTERSLYCERHGIHLSCMADGGKLCFLTEGDICSLFGNALENAIEAVSKLEHPEDRNISFQVRESRGMLVITVDNYFSGQLSFDGPLPQTTKEDSGYHGYGLKSIQMVAEKYGGSVIVSADDMFHLTVLLPLPERM